VVVEDAVAALDAPQVLLGERILHAAPHGLAVLHQLIEAVVGRFFFEKPVHR
jgi:hypothetical protein